MPSKNSIKEFLFKNTTNKQTFAKNTFWLGASEVSGRLLKMGLIIYAARVLGADGWGTFSYALSVASLLMIFSDIGLGGLITREIVQEKDGHVNFISTAIFLKNIVLVASLVLVIVICPIISNIPSANTLFPLVAVIFLFDALRELGFSINRAREKMEREMSVKTIMSIVILVLGILLLQINAEPRSIAIAYAVGSAVGFIIILSMMLLALIRTPIIIKKKIIMLRF